MFKKIFDYFKQTVAEEPVNIYRISLTSKFTYSMVNNPLQDIYIEDTLVYEVSEATSFGWEYGYRSLEDNYGLVNYNMYPVWITDKVFSVDCSKAHYNIERTSVHKWKLSNTVKMELIGNHLELGLKKDHKVMLG